MRLRWWRRMEKEQAGRSRDDLLRFAAKRITEMVIDDPRRSVAAQQAMALLEQIVLDGQPTPQPTPNDMDIDVMWLVNDWCVELIVTGEDDEEDDAGWILWAEDPDNNELFEARGRLDTLMDRDELRWTQHLLASMGDQIAGYDMWPVWKT